MERYTNDILPQDSNFAITKSTHTAKYNMNTSHYHGHYEILYIVKGKRKLIVNNVQSFELSENSIAIIAPGCIHRTVSASEEVQTKILIAVSEELMNEIFGFIFPSQLLKSVYVIKLSLKIKSGVQKLLEDMVSLEENDFKTNYQKVLTSELVLKLLECISPSEINEKEIFSNRAIKQRMNEIAMYVQRHTSEKLTLERIAEVFHIQKTYLARCFKKHFGITVTTYINSVRIIKAQEILKTTDVSIETVAYITGFESRVYFERVFKKITSHTPKEYRKNTKAQSLL